MPVNRDQSAKILSFAVHEFRTPMNVVAGYVRLLLRHYGDEIPEAQRRLLEEAEKSCGRLAALVAEISDYAQVTAGDTPLARRQVAVAPLLAEVAAGVSEGADRGVRVEVGTDGAGDAVVAGDRERLRAAVAAVLTAFLREQVSPGLVLVRATLDRTSDARPSVVTLIGGPAVADLAVPLDLAAWGPFHEFRGGMGFQLPLARAVIDRTGGRILSAREGGPRAAILIVLPLEGPPG